MTPDRPETVPPSTRVHLRFGWVALAVFVSMGLVLEALHGFKLGWYLDVDLENRRLLLTLAHAHGTLLAVLNLALAATARWMRPGRALDVTSWGLRGATVLLPAGFLLGGLWLHGTDPGLGILLVPAGGLLLLLAVLAGAVSAWSAR